jgi:hypothetical protein
VPRAVERASRLGIVRPFAINFTRGGGKTRLTTSQARVLAHELRKRHATSTDLDRRILGALLWSEPTAEVPLSEEDLPHLREVLALGGDAELASDAFYGLEALVSD